MEILLDDRPYQATVGEEQTVGELARQVCDAGQRAEQRFVVELRCDGQQVSDAGLDDVLVKPVGNYSRIELQTQSVLAMVRQTLSGTIDMLEEADDLRQRIADRLDEGQNDQAMDGMQRFFSLWKSVQDSMLLCAEAMGTNLDTIRVNDQGLMDILTSFKEQLNEIKSAMESGDYVMVADVLRYEIEQPLARWRMFMTRLHELAHGGEV